MAKKQLSKKQVKGKPRTVKAVKKAEIKHRRLVLFLKKVASLIVPVLIVSLLAANILSSTNTPTKFDKAKYLLVNNPKNIEAHLILADEFLNNNQNYEAKQELQITEYLLKTTNNSTNVLGFNSQYSSLLNQYKESNPDEIKKLITQWEKIISDNPGYRDGYLHLAVYYYKTGDIPKAKTNIENAFLLDPNNQTVSEFQSIIRGD